ncbi:MAG: tRNA (guanosine(37)-N1)-methyltransferase TrmD [Desulfobacterales bacterium]|nr:tRNA (guanosine(37)-N1)-methyltransferase TrmD [Desulfobacterales bacterium]
MKFVVLTIFPEMINPFLDNGMIRLAAERGIIDARAMNIRDFADGKHRVTDDKPYGGGCGMVMKPEPLSRAIHAASEVAPTARRILMTPQGRPFDQAMAQKFAASDGLIFICGRYEGVDERICMDQVDDEVSIGDYVMTGGELAAMVVIDAVTRLLPGVLGGEESAEKDSFSGGLLEHAHYTRPYNFGGKCVPDVLMSGNHAEIEKWRRETSLIRTFLKRPDLLEQRCFSSEEKKVLTEWCKRIEDLVG